MDPETIKIIDAQFVQIALIGCVGWWIYKISQWIKRTPEVPTAASEAAKTVAVHFIRKGVERLLKKK